MLSFPEVPSGLTAHKAGEVRAAVTMAPARKDYLQRAFVLQQPRHRVCMKRFREDGQLLPLGHAREDLWCRTLRSTEPLTGRC